MKQSKSMTDQYAVLGNPVGHSKSPIIHTHFAHATAQDLAYSAIEPPLGDFAKTVDAFRARGGKGINVTVPYKLDAFAYADHVTDRARLAGAVNALKFDDGLAYGDNFDGIGLVRDIIHNLSIPIKDKQVLILGAGGAVRGILEPLLAELPESMFIANRDVEKARALETLFAPIGPVQSGGYDAIITAGYDIIINATSASLSHTYLSLPPALFRGASLAYDLSYGKGLTPFLARAKAEGAAHLADGVGMLVEQAAETFAWWRGIIPETRAAIEAITVPLN